MKKKTKLRISYTTLACLFANLAVAAMCIYVSALMTTLTLSAEENLTAIAESVQRSETITLLPIVFAPTTYGMFYNVPAILQGVYGGWTSATCIAGHAINLTIDCVFLGAEITRALKIKRKYEIRNDYGSHGTAEWTDQGTVHDIYKDNNKVGWFFGTDIPDHEFKLDEYLEDEHNLFHPADNKLGLNMQCLVIGPPGSNKTTGFVIPNLLHIPKAYKVAGKPLPDIVCTDPKPELLPMTYKYYSELGYDIKIIDYVFQNYGDSINNLYYLETDKEVNSFCEMFMSTFLGKGEKSDVWFKAAKGLLSALVGYVVQKYPPDQRTMQTVMDVMQQPEVQDPEQAVEFFDHEGITGAALYAWKNFLSAKDSPETYSSILFTLSQNLTLFATKETQKQSNSNSCDIRLLGRKIISEKEAVEIRKAYKVAKFNFSKKEKDLQKYLFRRANSIIDGIELFYDSIYMDRTDYEGIINSTLEKVDNEISELLLQHLQLQEEEEAEETSQIEQIRNRLQALNIFKSQILDMYQRRKKRVETLITQYRNRLYQKQREVDLIKTKPIILYILVPDDDTSLQPLINTTVSSVFKQLYATAKIMPGTKLPTPVYLILEEFNNIGKIPDIEYKLGTMRSKCIYPMMIIQSLAQYKNRYPDEWENMLSQCDSLIVLGINDMFTAGQISDMLGSQTIKIQSTTDQHLTAITNDANQLQEQFHARKLLEKDELRTMDNTKMIILPRALHPMLLYKSQFKHWSNGWEQTDVHTMRKMSAQ